MIFKCQRKQSPSGRKIAQSGHPDFEACKRMHHRFKDERTRLKFLVQKDWIPNALDLKIQIACRLLTVFFKKRFRSHTAFWAHIWRGPFTLWDKAWNSMLEFTRGQFLTTWVYPQGWSLLPGGRGVKFVPRGEVCPQGWIWSPGLNFVP
jgi:hypothetical protein